MKFDVTPCDVYESMHGEDDDLRRQVVKNLSRQVRAAKDNLIREMLDHYFGPGNWTVDSVKGRVMRKILRDVNLEQYFIDDELMLSISDGPKNLRHFHDEIRYEFKCKKHWLPEDENE